MKAGRLPCHTTAQCQVFCVTFLLVEVCSVDTSLVEIHQVKSPNRYFSNPSSWERVVGKDIVGVLTRHTPFEMITLGTGG